jgi:uncharacterized protein (TIGR02099 family)
LKPSASRRHSIFRLPTLANARLSSRFSSRPALRLAKHGSLWLYRVVTVGLLITALVLGGTVLLLRYWVLPNIDEYRDEIAGAISRAARQRITVGAVEGRWDGFRPRLVIRDLRVYDRSDAERLALASVDGTLSWVSLLGEVRFHTIELDRLAIEVRRDERGAYAIAGIPLQKGGNDRGFGDWLLEQHRIAVRQSSLTWIDETLGGVPLVLRDVELVIDRQLGGWRVGLQAAPPIEVASPIDLRGELQRDRFGAQREWRGWLYLGFNYADLAALRQWLPLPADVQRGAGGLELWADLDGSRVIGAIADLRLSDVSLRLRSHLPYLDLSRLSGRVRWAGDADNVTWSTRNLSFTTPDGLQLPPADLTYRRAGAEGRAGTRSEVRFDSLDLAAVVRLVDRLPLDDDLRQRVAEMNPRGTLRGFQLDWTGPLEARTQYAARGRFERISVAPSGYLPGFSTVSGELQVDQTGGKLSLQASGSQLAMPRVFAGPLPLDDMAAQLSWTMQPQGPVLRVETLTFANAHLAGNASGTYRTVPGEPGMLDVTGSLQRGDGREGWRYLPLRLSAKLRGWLQHAIVAAQARDVRFRLSGDLHRFPFADGKSGLFEVVTQFDGGTLAYANGWPALEGLSGEIVFRNASMQARLDAGRLYGLRLRAATVAVADLTIPEPLGEVRGEAEGPSADFLQFIASSPVNQMVGGFTDEMRASGTGALSLALDLPLREIEHTRVSGRYRFAANTLEPGHRAPRVEQLSGQLEFNDREVRLQDGTARVLRMPVRFTAERTAGSPALLIRGSGRADAPALRALTGQRWTEALSGAADWQGTLRIEDGNYDLAVSSELRGLGSALPLPLAKETAAPMRFDLQRRSVPGGRDLTIASAGNVFSAQWLETHTQPAQLLRAEIRLNEAAPAPRRDGIWVGGRVERLDVDRWRSLLSGSDSGSSGRGGASLFAARVIAFGREWHDVSLQAAQKDRLWQAQVAAREAVGGFVWNTEGAGTLQARFARLHLPEPVPSLDPQGATTQEAAAQERLPAINVLADDFRSGERQFGRLTLIAVPEGEDWRIRQLQLRSPEGTLSMNGTWRGGAVPVTRLDVQADVNDIGAYFARLRLPPGVAGGSGTLSGQLGWNGPPQSVDMPSLTGSFKLEAKRGRFVRIEPGIGKLIGVLSLQALPRRVALDFRDVFSEGFAFDRIAGSAVIDRGVARTEDLLMTGSSARVEMGGEINLAGETQRLDVKIVPSMSESVALGAAIVNPAVGLATLLAQKALKDPISQMIAFEYEVSGTWADPMVMKKRRDAPKDGRRGRK